MQAEVAQPPAGAEEAAAPVKERVEWWSQPIVEGVAEVLEWEEAGAEEQPSADSHPKEWGRLIPLTTALALAIRTLVRQKSTEEEQAPGGMLWTSGQLRTGVKICQRPKCSLPQVPWRPVHTSHLQTAWICVR